MTMWHVLDAGSIWIKEFASALSRRVDVQTWIPEMRWTGLFETWRREETLEDPPLRPVLFPLQRGYARFPLSVLPWARAVHRMMMDMSNDEDSVLICTTPFYAPVAEAWKGPVIYYLTDFNAGYVGVNAEQIHALDRRMANVASLVCPNSERTGRYLVDQGCPPEKVLVIPNATREKNIPAEPLLEPAPLPEDLAALPRPVAGVLGNLASNMDWLLLRETIRRTPSISWAFIGPVNMDIPDPDQRAARGELIQMGGRVMFTGPKPYGALQEYSRCLDVAVMPYVRKEPTFSGSATRFYEHLAACRPILALPGVEELLSKEPLLRLVNSAQDMTTELGKLKATNFRDGLERMRWEASREGTWECRAESMIAKAAELGLCKTLPAEAVSSPVAAAKAFSFS